MKPTWEDLSNPIVAAVAPLKGDAMNRAEEKAREIIARTAKELAAAGSDLQKCAPYPDSNMSRANYATALTRYKRFSALTKWRAGTYRPNEPHFADMESERCEKYVKDARDNAAAQYDAFVSKLVQKIGTVKSATLEGSHVWGYSFLTVEKDTGPEIWKTQMILNVSKLGLIFNQFPTRKVKSKVPR